VIKIFPDQLSVISLFGSVVAVAFQSDFNAETHQNDIFFIFKKLFLRSAHQNDSKNNFYKKKLNFFRNVGITAFPNAHLCLILVF